MAYILNLETATRNCSVGLALHGKIIVLNEHAGEGYAHAEKLHVFIDDVLKEAGISYKDLSAVAVSMGPGSYTGLRIGVSAAKGLCYSLNIPLIAIDTLEVLALAITPENGCIVPMIDARRMEAYTAVFSHDHKKLRSTEAEIIDEESFAALARPVHLIGDGAAKCKELLSGDDFVYHDNILFPSAAQMAALSFYKHQKSDTVDVAYFEPYYLKDFIAGKP